MRVVALTHFVDEALLLELIQEDLLAGGLTSDSDSPHYWNDYYWVDDIQVSEIAFSEMGRYLADAGVFISGRSDVQPSMVLCYRTYFEVSDERAFDTFLQAVSISMSPPRRQGGQ